MPAAIYLLETCQKKYFKKSGKIFVKNAPNYRYMEAGEGVTTKQLNISMTECGTETFEEQIEGSTELKTGFSNILIMQMDPEVQEVWDTARKIKCEWVEYIQKHVEFQPFEVDMLDFEEVKFEGDSVECFMDLQAGKYPDSRDIEEAVKIGEPLSLIVYMEDAEEMYDIHVKV